MTPTLPLAPPPRPRLQLWLSLLALGLLGFALAAPYFLQVFGALAAKGGRPLPPLPVLFLAEGLKVVALCAVLGWLGLWAMPRTGLDAPLLRARLRGEPVGAALGRLVPRALLWGTLGSLAVLGLNLALGEALPAAMRLQAVDLGGQSKALAVLVGASSAFYGGFVEELMMRWGLLSVVMAGAVRLLDRVPAFWVANLVSAALFGAGHLPLALSLGGGATVVAYTLLGNMLVGLLCGWLFFRHGFEQAILTHAWADVALHAVPILFLAR